MKKVVCGLIFIFWIQAFATEPIVPGDLEESGMDSVAIFNVTWDQPLVERHMTSRCDGYSWDRILITVPSDVPFEYSFHTLEWVDYGERVFLEPGGRVSGFQAWKQDEVIGLNRLLFKGLSRIFIIFRTKTNPHREFRLGITGPC